MEYLFELEESDGRPPHRARPGEPRPGPRRLRREVGRRVPRVRRRRAWLGSRRAGGDRRDLGGAEHGARGDRAGHAVGARGSRARDAPAACCWSTTGPEFAALGGSSTGRAAMVAAGTHPPFRVALLAPGDRNRWYAVNPAYARALTGEVIPALVELAPSPPADRGRARRSARSRCCTPTDSRRARSTRCSCSPAASSRRDLDPQERRFSRFGPVTRFVARDRTRPWPTPPRYRRS